MGVPDQPPLLAVRGEASAQEVAALVAVLQAMAGATAAAREAGRPPPRPVWSAPHRLVRRPAAGGPDGWRTSALPR